MRYGEFKCVVNFQQVVTEATVEERYTKNVKQQQQQLKVSSSVSTVVVDKGNIYLENKTCSKTWEASQEVYSQQSRGKFSRKVSYRITRGKSSVSYRVLKVKPVELLGRNALVGVKRVSLVMSAGVVSNSSRNINSNSRGNNSTRSRRPKSVPR